MKFVENEKRNISGKIPNLANEISLKFSCSCDRSPLIQEFDAEIICYHLENLPYLSLSYFADNDQALIWQESF